MDIYAKIRTLAAADPTLAGLFFNGVPRWFKQQLQPGYIARGLCVRVNRVSTIYGYLNAPAGLMNQNSPLMQFDILGLDSTAVQAATIAVITWMGTVNFVTTNDFDSPATTPPNSPNFLLNRRSGMEAQVEGGTVSPSSSITGPVWVESLDFRIFNTEN